MELLLRAPRRHLFLAVLAKDIDRYAIKFHEREPHLEG